MTPIATRIKNRAEPGRPPGNVENSLCSAFLPSTSTQDYDSMLHRSCLAATHDIPVSFHHSFGVLVLSEIHSLKLDDPTAYADRYGLCAITCPQLFHDVLDMDLHGFFRDEEPLSDIPIAVTARDLTEDLH